MENFFCCCLFTKLHTSKREAEVNARPQSLPEQNNTVQWYQQLQSTEAQFRTVENCYYLHGEVGGVMYEKGHFH